MDRLRTLESLWEAWRDPIRVLIRVLQLQGRGASAATIGNPIPAVPLAQVATRGGVDYASFHPNAEIELVELRAAPFP